MEICLICSEDRFLTFLSLLIFVRCQNSLFLQAVKSKIYLQFKCFGAVRKLGSSQKLPPPSACLDFVNGFLFRFFFDKLFSVFYRCGALRRIVVWTDNNAGAVRGLVHGWIAHGFPAGRHFAAGGRSSHGDFAAGLSVVVCRGAACVSTHLRRSQFVF